MKLIKTQPALHLLFVIRTHRGLHTTGSVVATLLHMRVIPYITPFVVCGVWCVVFEQHTLLQLEQTFSTNTAVMVAERDR